MKLFLLSALVFSFQTYAACTYKLSTNSTKVSWKAYKTPKKVGVDGEFKKFTITPSKAEASSVDELVQKTKFQIDSSSVSTNNPARDNTIFTNFFKTEGKALHMSGEVMSVSKDSVVARMLLGTTSKDVTLKRTQTGKVIKLEGSISVLDFGLKSNLDKLATACKALHEGVTWPEVNVAVEFSVDESCK